MRLDKQLMWQVARFLVAGCTGVVVDYVTYRAFIWLGLHTDISKLLGFCAGSIFAYFAHKHFTFQVKEKSSAQVLKFIVLYAFNMGLNVAVNAATLMVIGEQHKVWAFLVATAVTTVTSFLGQKFWVMTQRPVLSKEESGPFLDVNTVETASQLNTVEPMSGQLSELR